MAALLWFVQSSCVVVDWLSLPDSTSPSRAPGLVKSSAAALSVTLCWHSSVSLVFSRLFLFSSCFSEGVALLMARRGEHLEKVQGCFMQLHS